MVTRRLLLLTLVAAIALPLLAARKTPTAPGKYEGWGPDIDSIEILKTFRAADYIRVVVEPLDVKGVERSEDKDVATKVDKVLAIATEPFAEGLRHDLKNLPVVDSVPADAKGTLLVRGRVTVMDPGSRAKRMFVGYGAGAARAAVTAEIVDAATGEVLVRLTQERRSGIERFGRGSSYEEIMKRNLVAIGEDVARTLREF